MRSLLLALGLMMTAVAPGSAAEALPAVPALLSVGVGKFDAFDNIPRDEAADFRLEYRFGSGALIAQPASWVVMRPWTGIEVTSDGGAYAAGGFAFDLMVGSFIITPSFGAGAFLDGGGKNMGHLLEFRTGLEGAWQFHNGMRVGAAVSHISNAEIGDENPGAEIVSLYLHIPIDSL